VVGDVTEVAGPGACVTVRIAGVPVRLVRQHTPGLPFVLNGLLRCGAALKRPGDGLPTAQAVLLHCPLPVPLSVFLLTRLTMLPHFPSHSIILVRHEEKTSVVHFSITKMPGVEDAIKSKVCLLRLAPYPLPPYPPTPNTLCSCPFSSLLLHTNTFAHTRTRTRLFLCVGFGCNPRPPLALPSLGGRSGLPGVRGGLLAVQRPARVLPGQHQLGQAQV
jgi:hypothetical protein